MLRAIGTVLNVPLLVHLLAMAGCAADTKTMDPESSDRVVFYIETQFLFCSRIDGVDVFPLEVAVPSYVQLRAITEEGSPFVTWHAESGRFSDPDAARTRYSCTHPGEHVLTVMLDEGTPCEDEYSVEVTCSPSLSCANGQLEAGEQCDDGNREGGDGCSERCTLEVD